jgi:hypothetical protein|tara:strand:- start:1908 stop:2132 length:225 start_codon:yes stop_codon:yes gene_type:complete
MGFLKSISGYLVGEDSKKRQMGISVAIGLSCAYYLDFIPLSLYEAMMPFVILWTGAAFSAKLSKLQGAIKEAKK